MTVGAALSPGLVSRGSNCLCRAVPAYHRPTQTAGAACLVFIGEH
jgi:hypothetical protein